MKKIILIMLLLSFIVISNAMSKRSKTLPPKEQIKTASIKNTTAEENDKNLEIKKEKYYQKLKNYYGDDISPEFDKLFKELVKVKIFKNMFLSTLSDKEKREYAYLIWVLKEKYPIKSARLEYGYKKDDDLKGILKRTFITAYVMDRNKKESSLKKTARINQISLATYVIGKVTNVDKPQKIDSFAELHRIPISIEVFEAIGDKFDKKKIDCAIAGPTNHPYEYMPAIGDTILARIIITYDIDDKLHKLADPCLIKNGIIYENKKKQIPWHVGLLFGKQKCSIEEYKRLWQKEFDHFMKGGKR